MLTLTEISSIVVYFLFFLPYLGMAFPAYIIALLLIIIAIPILRIKLKIFDLFFLGLFFLFFFLKIGQVGIGTGEVFLRYFFGWLLFYYYFRLTKAKIHVDRLLKIYCFCVIIEAILINTILPPVYWKNFPDLEIATTHVSAFFGFFQRPYSVGGNASVASTILCLMLFYIENLRKKGVQLITRGLEVLSGITIILFASGVGMCIYLIYWAYKKDLFLKRRNIILLVSFIVVVLGFAIYASTLSTSNILSKLSVTYFEFLWQFKAIQIEETVYALKHSSFWLGFDYHDNSGLLLWNDFALRDLFHSLGIGGVLFMLVFLLDKINKYNWIIIIVGVLGLLHYGGIFSMSGQLIFGYALVLNSKTFSYYTKDDL
ncbi:MAG TPA: hypothetical protein IAA79_08255 [Candidatus Avirikenella pullistercoris]|uniref:hypothetical protein n=1 Tax=Coprobacter fastidiosus TaxID=1099853 RepID=UPI001FA1E3DC|nr:hypothetical protein [Candidatus Avirikenella pullistercoris]